jgi:ABC-type uncharacterized transport system permease subunit
VARSGPWISSPDPADPRLLTVRLATPLLLACLAGLYSERAGIFDIGLEGKMLAAAFFSAAIAFTSGSVWIGLFAGITASVLLSGCTARPRSRSGAIS